MTKKDSSQSKSSAKRRKTREKEPKHGVISSYKLLGDKLTIYRTNKSGPYWSMSCWLPTEKKAYRKSLRIINRQDAIEAAQKEYFRLMNDIDSGRPVFSKKAKELVVEYIKDKQDAADVGSISQGRVKTITTSLKWFLKFVKEDTALDKIKSNDFKSYYIWRLKQSPNVKKDTVANEQSLISSLFKFGRDNGVLRYDQVPQFSRIKKTSVDRREAFTKSEYQKLSGNFSHWIKEARSEREATDRLFVRDFIALSRYTGLRFGEMRKLKWHMIKLKPNGKFHPDNEPIVNIEIMVPKDTKTGERKAFAERGDVFNRIKKYSRFTKLDDFIFVNNDTGKPLNKKIYYEQWDSLMRKSKLLSDDRDLTYYSLRHLFITERVGEDANLLMLAKSTGTSVRMIETHYAHPTDDEMMYQMTKKRQAK